MTRRAYGLLFEFPNATALLEAARYARKEGFQRVEAYSPFPIEGLAEVLEKKKTSLPWLTLAGAAVGALLGYSAQYYFNVVDYPLNVGGRPLHSWPAFLLVTFEVSALFAALTAFVSFFVVNGLPMPSHPLFQLPTFQDASQHRFFLCIRPEGLGYDLAVARRLIEPLRPLEIWEVPDDESVSDLDSAQPV